MTEIFAFGDSITYGKWDAEKGGWAQRLSLDLDKKIIASNFEEYFTLYNLGISGDTTETLLNRFDSEIGTRYREKGECVILIAIGINDVQYSESNQSFEVPIGQSEENFKALFVLAKEYTDNIIVVGLTPVDETKMSPCPWLPDISFKNADVKRYDAMIQTLCDEEGISYVSAYDALTTNLLIDGLHPNARGHEKLYTIIKKVLEERKLI